MPRLNFLLNTFGSLGDLHPYIAVGCGLRDRGHRVTIATSEIYRTRVEAEGLRFHAVRPDIAGLADSAAAMERAYHPRTGSEYIMRTVFMPHVTQSYQDLLAVAHEADILVGHPLALALSSVAETLGKPWVSVILQPAVILSEYDPPSVSGAPHLELFRRCGPVFWRLFFRLVRAITKKWARPLNALRQDLGFRPVDNLLDAMFSPFLNQAWFSPVLARPQPDWPQGLTATGFPVYDKLEPGQTLSPELEQFLAAGSAPVVFTLGSSAVLAAGDFYKESVLAVRQLGIRAILLIGNDSRNRPDQADPNVFVGDYAPYSQLFPRAAAVVHQGGAGTTAQVLHVGIPAIFVPYSHDQPDNARRVTALGAARTIPRSKYRAPRITSVLREVLADETMRATCTRIAKQLAAEDGVRTACEGLEQAAIKFRDVGNRSRET